MDIKNLFTYHNIREFFALLDNIVSSAAALIAVGLFIFKRKKISSAFKMLMNYASQATIAELISKLEKINQLRVHNERGKQEIINILHEIHGQIKGNEHILVHCQEIILRIESFYQDPSLLDEPSKRTLVSQLRAQLKNLDLSNSTVQ